MCGRYAASLETDEIVETFAVDVDASPRHSRSLLSREQHPPAGAVDYNMAPSKQAPVVLSREPGERQLRLLTWGLVPAWAKDTKIGMRMINARVETLLDKPSFAQAAQRRRTLIPAQGWYEWQASPVARDSRGKPRKQPFFISRTDEQPVAFAGIYEFWKDREAPDPEADDAWVVSFTILTTAAEPGLDRIHERQPLVLEPDQWSDWLDPEQTEPVHVRRLISGPGLESPGRFQTWAISTQVNSVGRNGPGLLAPAPTDELTGVVDPATGEVIGG